MRYDYLVVGSGLYGAVFAHEMKKLNKKCLVIEKRNHIAGNIYSENIKGIEVHKYGPHIFHTDSEFIWRYVNELVKFERYIYEPIARYKDEIYNLPFNMNTFYQMWQVKTPQEALIKLNEQRGLYANIEPINLEEQALKLVGRDIYTKLIKGYTEKQWGCSAKELPEFIIRRLPLRFTFKNNYFNDKFQGIAINGYTALVQKLLQGIEVKTDTDFFADRDYFMNLAKKIVFTGQINQFFNDCFGALEYRSLRFEEESLSQENYQGVAVVNYTEKDIPYTRIVEHKHFLPVNISDATIITKEYPVSWDKSIEPFYPINNEKNNKLYNKYLNLSAEYRNVIFGGRLGEYKYYDMDKVIEASLRKAKVEKIHSSDIR